MIDSLLHFISFVFRDFPTFFIVGFGVVFGVGTILLLSLLGWRRGWRWSAGLLLFDYVILLFALAVLTRRIHSPRAFDFTPFWSYRAILDGDPFLLNQIIANVGAFIPIGALICCAFVRLKWWNVLAIGGGVSVMIELLQFVLKRGFAEFDDVFHNTLGCAIGFGVYFLMARLVSRFRKSRK